MEINRGITYTNVLGECLILEQRKINVKLKCSGKGRTNIVGFGNDQEFSAAGSRIVL